MGLNMYVHDGYYNCGTAASNLCCVAEDCKHWYKMPTDTEFSTLQAIVKIFELLSCFTDALLGEKHVTASAFNHCLSICIKRYCWYLLMIALLQKEWKQLYLMTSKLVIQSCWMCYLTNAFILTLLRLPL